VSERVFRYPELAEAERFLRAWSSDPRKLYRDGRGAPNHAAVVVAELDRQRALISNLLAECERRKRELGWANAAWISADEVKRWLGEERQ